MIMKSNKFFALFIFLALLAGCAAPTPLPQTSTPVPPTDTLVPTKTPIPAATSTPTATPYPPLSAKGPYWVYLGSQDTIVFLDANGTGRKEILLPEHISRQTYDSLSNLSPDGKWLAYYTGKPDAYNIFSSIGIPSEGPYNLALNLYNLETKESKLVTPLLSKDFPNNFQKQLDIFKKTGLPSELQHLPDEYQMSTLYGTFLRGITSFSWSPDGHYLAFAGQMNGLSSDLYVYDVKSQTIRQISSDPEEIQWISWSPTGKDILYGSTYEAAMGMKCKTYIADLGRQSVRYLSEGMRCYPPDDWLDDFTFLEHENENGTGDFHLRSVNTRTGGITMQWEGSFGTYAVDSKEKLILINADSDTYPFPTSGFKPGLYLIGITSGKRIRLLDNDYGDYWKFEFFGIGERRFIVHNAPSGAQFVAMNGTFIPMDDDYSSAFLAPNQQYWARIADKIFIFTANGMLVREIDFPKTIVTTNDVKFVTIFNT
jgi:WD40 repeat protein